MEFHILPQMGKEHKQLRRHKVKLYKQKAKWTALYQQLAIRQSYKAKQTSQRQTLFGWTMTNDKKNKPQQKHSWNGQ